MGDTTVKIETVLNEFSGIPEPIEIDAVGNVVDPDQQVMQILRDRNKKLRKENIELREQIADLEMIF